MTTTTLYCAHCGRPFNGKVESCPRCGCPRDGKPQNAICPDCHKPVNLDLTNGLYYCNVCESVVQDPIFDSNKKSQVDDPLGLQGNNYQSSGTYRNQMRSDLRSNGRTREVAGYDQAKPVKNTSGDLPVCPTCGHTRLVWQTERTPSWVFILFVIGVLTFGFFGWVLWAIAIYHLWKPKPLVPYCPICKQFFPSATKN